MDYITLMPTVRQHRAPYEHNCCLACLAGLFFRTCRQFFDIGPCGQMLAAAFFRRQLASLTGNVLLGLFGGIAASMALSLLPGCHRYLFGATS